MTSDAGAARAIPAGAAHRSEDLPDARRIAEIDALRGFALLGILLVNALMMAGPYGLGGELGTSALDRAVQWLVTALVTSKFYVLFAFLFGCSFTLQQRSAERAGVRFGPRRLRRSAGMLILGFTHAVLLYPGDILMAYALLGLVLFAGRKAGRGAVRTAWWWFGLAGAVLLLIGTALALLPQEAARFSTELSAEAAQLTDGYRGDAASVVATNAGQLDEVLFGVVQTAGHVVPAFLLGMVAARHGRPALSGVMRRRLHRTLRLGLAAGLPGGAFMALAMTGPLGPRWEILGTAVGTVTAPALTAAYTSAMLLWLGRPSSRRVWPLLAAAGRMSLTNYLLQSLVLALVFTGYGLALYGRLGAATVTVGALLLYTGQLLLSHRALRRFRYGPAEWLLRAVTHGRRPAKTGRPRLPRR
ncbi:hypothetical protein DSC45_24650 [Streptomyces sp. YIM 130001]|uniref:DUF418 domain-containing protein n=1 Tax=Streptomyces sp. YIM 130001 TaxID=2259644 RepID=UPI000E6509D5|nr:DUF418 domain-containing protein [Streptomyces sp. YIM 130001]RII13044.1 hypothetical protein DSC45_24650 [Streptomyces sp. YIM 130001]